MALLKRRDKEEKRGGFKYKARGADSMQSRAERRTGGGDSVVRDDVKFFQATEGDHDIRYLPPTWDEPEHFGYDVWVHYGIGPDNSSYLCLAKMKGEACACCEERARAQKEDEEELAYQLRPSNRVGVWIIDRRAEREGPKMWLQPVTFDKEVCAQAVDKKRHSVINLDDPEDGYDISFTVEGKGINKKYKGVKADRSPSPLSDDEEKAQEWLDYVKENPVPDCLVFKDYDAIASALEGGVRVGDNKDGAGKKRGKRDEDDEKLKEVEERGKKQRPRIGKNGDDEKEERSAHKRKRGRDEEDETEEEDEDEGERGKKSAKGKKKLEPVDLTWDEIHALDEDELEELANEHEIDEDDFSDCEDTDDIADIICERLGVKKPKKGKPKDDDEDGEEEEAPAKESWKDKLKRLRKEGK